MRLSDVFRTILKVINFRKILVEKPARFWNRLIAVMLSDEVLEPLNRCYAF